MALSTQDWIVVGVCGVFAVRGAFKGFAWQAVRTVGLVAAILAANLFYERFGGWLDAHLPIPDAAVGVAAWALIAIGVFFVLGIFAYMARGLVRSVNLTTPDRFLGLLMGAVMGFVLCTVAFSVYASFQEDAETKATFGDSKAARYMAQVVGLAEPLAPEPIRKHWMGVFGAIKDAVPDEAPSR